MTPKVVSVTAREDYTLEITFTDRSRKVFDVKPYLEYGIFRDLKRKDIFFSAKVEGGTVAWIGGQDFCRDTLFAEGRSL